MTVTAGSNLAIGGGARAYPPEIPGTPDGPHTERELLRAVLDELITLNTTLARLDRDVRDALPGGVARRIGRGRASG